MTSPHQRDTNAPTRSVALVRIIEDHDSHLRRFVRSRTANSDECEDIVQEVYLRLAGYQDIVELQDPRPFILRIAENLMRDRARRAAHRLSDRHDPLQENTALADPAPGPDSAAAGSQELALVRDAILVMPEPARTAFVLSRYEELNYREIASRMNVSVKTVEKYMSNALRYLREVIGDVTVG